MSVFYFPIVKTYSDEVLFKNSWHENFNNNNTIELQENWNDNLNWIEPISFFMFRDLSLNFSHCLHESIRDLIQIFNKYNKSKCYQIVYKQKIFTFSIKKSSKNYNNFAS